VRQRVTFYSSWLLGVLLAAAVAVEPGVAYHVLLP
jgi:cyd operon protein YbgT